MNNLDKVIFVDSLPKLDLHGYDRECAKIAINDFIKDNTIMKNKVIAIVHGKGTGILKKATYEVLKKSNKVTAYKTYYYNDGCTIVELII